MGIKYFDCLWFGSVDMDNLGYAGTPVNSRRFGNAALSGVLDKGRTVAQALDRAGYDTFWFAEHHFQREGYECIPNSLLYATHLCGVTERLRFGCGFNITPMWHPLRLAEDYAVADALTGGRVTFGVGRGYHTREVETFGAPLLDQAANRDLFEEQVDILFKAFDNEAFSHQSARYALPAPVEYRGYELEELTLVPRPQRLPVECWQPIQSGTERGLDFMVKHGMHGMIGGGSAVSGPSRKLVDAWVAAHRRAGIDILPGERLALGYTFYMADTLEQGLAEAAPYHEENVKMFAPLRLIPALTPQQVVDIADPATAVTAGLPTIESAVRAGAFLCGPAEGMIASLRTLEREYPGLERIQLSFSSGMSEAVMIAQAERFAREVMPAFPEVAQARAAAR